MPIFLANSTRSFREDFLSLVKIVDTIQICFDPKTKLLLFFIRDIQIPTCESIKNPEFFGAYLTGWMTVCRPEAGRACSWLCHGTRIGNSYATGFAPYFSINSTNLYVDFKFLSFFSCFIASESVLTLIHRNNFLGIY
jgi:hypothetical protein